MKTSKDDYNKKHGLYNILYTKNITRRLGKNEIMKLVTPLAKKAGVENYERFTGNSIRRYCLTKLSNDENLSAKEIAEHARHCSINTQNHYITTNQESQVQRQMVLGKGYDFLCEDTSMPILPLKEKRPPVESKKEEYIPTVVSSTPARASLPSNHHPVRTVRNPYYPSKSTPRRDIIDSYLVKRKRPVVVRNPYIKNSSNRKQLYR